MTVMDEVLAWILQFKPEVQISKVEISPNKL
jgi:hypothetical protein